MTFGERLVELRKENGFNTRNEFAEKLGIPSTTLRNYEKNEREPGHTFLKQVSELFNVSVDYLLCLTDEKEILKTFRLRTSEQDLVKKYRALDPSGQDAVNYTLDHETTRVQQLTELRSRPAAVIDFQARSDQVSRLAEYFRSASAGGGVFILGNEATSKIAISESDWDDRVDYVISVSGDSMEPDFVDGDKVMVSQRVEIRHGDIGIFIVDGKAYIKEYGEQELISRNHARPNIKISEYNNIVCMGKVIGKLNGPFQIVDD